MSHAVEEQANLLDGECSSGELNEDNTARDLPTEPEDQAGDIVSTFALFKNYFDKKLVSLKRDIREEALNTTASVAKKLKEDSDITFKFEGNKKQFKFNSGLANQVSSATSALKRKRYDTVKSCLEELDKQIRKRNKLIRLADKSAAGWDLVSEYLSDELASGSEDEKRIRKAEQTALRKKNLRNQQRLKTARHQTNRVNQPYTSSTTTNPRQIHQPFASTRTPRQYSQRNPRPDDICFGCGQQGHWRSNCSGNSRSSQVPNRSTATGGNP